MIDGKLFDAPGGSRIGRRRLCRDRDSELRPRRPQLPEHSIRSERQMLDLLEGVYHLDDLADAAEDAGLADLNGGRGHRRRGDVVFRHRIRSALDARKRAGTARPLGDAYWVIDGPAPAPRRAVFVFLGAVSDITLAVAAAADAARRIGEPVDLVFCDPAWQLGVGQGRDGRPGSDQYGRPRDLIIPGYREVPPDTDYYAWSLEWIQAAARVLRPGGCLAVATGPQQAAAVQIAAQHSGLLFSNSIAVPLANGVRPTRHRYATSHIRLTVMNAPGPRRTFNALPEMGLDDRGQPALRDVWPPVLPHYSRGRRLRYPNQQPPALADQVIRSWSDPGDLVADFFAGSGTVPRLCLFRGRRCFASDLNEHAVRFTMASIADIARSELAAPPMDGPIFPGLPAADEASA